MSLTKWKCSTCGKEYNVDSSAPLARLASPAREIVSVWCVECKMRQKLGRCEIQETQEVKA